MRKLILLLLLSFTTLLIACGNKVEELPQDYSEYQDTTNNLIDDALSQNQPTEAEEAPTPTPEEVEQEKVILAKTYKQVYPELYTFYDADPDKTYSKWIYTLDRSSGFIGTIYMKDGTVLISKDLDNEDDGIAYDRESNLGGIGGTDNGFGQGNANPNEGDNNGSNGSNTGNGTNSNPTVPGGSNNNTNPNNGNGNNNNSGNSGSGNNQGNGNTSQKEVGDKTTNPTGKDVVMKSPTGDYNVEVSTKVLPGAIIDEANSTDYILKFSTSGVRYTLSTQTIDGTMKKLMEDGLYQLLPAGTLSVDQNRLLTTNKGTFTTYVFKEQGTGIVYDYAVTYTPKYSANTMYTLYADNIQNNKDIFSMLQKMVSEG